MATIHDILSFAYPDRGGWTVHGDYIAAGDGGSIPTLEKIESHREAAEEDIAEKAEAIAARKIWQDSAHFLESFSLAETAAISISSDATIAALRLILATWGNEIWSDDARIVAGLDALVAAQIITTQRREAIIAK
jgi:hypothetical protein